MGLIWGVLDCFWYRCFFGSYWLEGERGVFVVCCVFYVFYFDFLLIVILFSNFIVVGLSFRFLI